MHSGRPWQSDSGRSRDIIQRRRLHAEFRRRRWWREASAGPIADRLWQWRISLPVERRVELLQYCGLDRGNHARAVFSAAAADLRLDDPPVF